MATPPTFVAEHETSWTSTSTGTAKTASHTTLVGDILAILMAGENGSTTLGLTSGGTGTYVNQENVGSGGNDAKAKIDTAVTGISAQTFNTSVTMSAGGNRFWGYNSLQFRGSDGIGAAESAVPAGNAAPTLAITTTQDNSAIAVIVVDWNAVDGATRTWRAVNSITPTLGNNLERTYFRDAAAYTVYVAYYSDAGTAGAKTVGLSAPAGQHYATAAVEIKGTAGAAATSPALRRRDARMGALLQL